MPSDPSYRFPSVRLAVCLDNVSVAGAVSRPFRQRDATGHLPGGQGAIMATDARAELRVDVHAIEPIPEADRDSTGLQQMWIWAGANIAPINWALGALGIVLKLGLWETIAVIVLGNIVGCGIFAAFTVMGHKTGVNQMVLGRSAFGRRGAYLPSMLMFLMTLGWIGVDWGSSWVTWASDYSRFVPRNVSSTAVFWYSYIGMFLPTVWLAILGATVASVTKDTDPAKMVSAVFGGVTSILVLLMVLHGPIATNILNVYSAALAALSMGLRLSRTALALIAGVVGYLATIYFVFQPSFAQAFDNWMISLLLWMSPWAGIVLTDFFIVRHGRIDVGELYREPERSAYGDINWGAIVAFVVGLVAGWSVEDGLVPALKGPISIKLLSGADLSWLVGIVVAGGAYLLLGRRVVSVPVARPMRGAR